MKSMIKGMGDTSTGEEGGGEFTPPFFPFSFSFSFPFHFCTRAFPPRRPHCSQKR